MTSPLMAPKAKRLMVGPAWWKRQPRPVRIVTGVGLIVLLYLLPSLNLPIITTHEVAFDSLLASTVAPFVMVAIGLNVVVGMAGLLDLGYVGFYAVGAYTLGLLSALHGKVPWAVCVPIAIGVSMLAGVILGAPTLRLRGDYLAIVTLGFGEIIRIVANNTLWLGAAEGISKIKRPPTIGPLKFGVLDKKPYYWLGLTMIIVVVFLLRRLENSRVGRAFTAIREDEDAAELMGVPTFKYKLLAFAIGAAVGGLAGTMYAGTVAFINPPGFDLTLSILFLAAVVLGGSGNMWGVILGAIAVSYLPERIRFLKEQTTPAKHVWLNHPSRFLVFGLLLVIMMIVRPQGLIPRKIPSGAIDQPDFPGLAGADLSERPGGGGDE
jgi:branched-chain amino acid transport system permease protein